MKAASLAIAAAGLILGACAQDNPPVASDARWPFDTVRGMYGGNEYQARSPEGKITYAGDAKSAAPSAAQSTPSPAAAPAATPAAATAIASAGAAPSGEEPRRIAIDLHAFSAVFPGASGPVRPSAEQLMQLDSLALVAAEPTRTQLQQEILACRQAGSRCLLTWP